MKTAHGILRAPGRFARGSPVLLGIRPERISFGAGEGHNSIAPRLSDIVFQGARVQAHFASSEDEPILLETSARLPAEITPNAEQLISWAPEDTLVFPRTAGA